MPRKQKTSGKRSAGSGGKSGPIAIAPGMTVTEADDEFFAKQRAPTEAEFERDLEGQGQTDRQAHPAKPDEHRRGRQRGSMHSAFRRNRMGSADEGGVRHALSRLHAPAR